MSAIDSGPLLALADVSRTFGGVRAVDHLDMAIPAGAVVGLIGPNGAGKTTVINLVTGLLRPTSGTISLAGRPIDTAPTYRIAASGVVRTYQNIRLFRSLTALENVVVGSHHVRPNTLLGRLVFAPGARAEERRVRERAAGLMREVGLSGKEYAVAGSLPYGDQRRLEIARSLAAEPRMILLDEPAAGMPFGETARLMDLIRGLPRRGVTVLLVEHNMHLVMNVCDRIVVLNFGHKIAEGTPTEVSGDPQVIEAYLGSEDEDAA